MEAPTQSQTAVSRPPQIGGQDVVELTRGRSGDGTQPEFLSATVLPGRGMNLFQITAWIPGRGETPILASPSLEDAAKVLNDDEVGTKSFTMGGAFLAPFANRIRGKLSKDGKTLTFQWNGESQTLPANWQANDAGKPKPGHERHAIHGLILDAKTDTVSNQKSEDGGSVAGLIHAGGSHGEWFSQNDVLITISLTGKAVDATVMVRNIGDKPEPVGIGWHPYFALPSGDRANARLRLPGDQYAVVNNYDDVFPTGKALPVKGTPLDFTIQGGAPLPDKLVDDNFLNLTKNSNGDSFSEIVDVGAKYGLRITALTPQVNTVQVYAPTNKSFIALEPQFNYNDPFGKEWKGQNTGMVTLKAGDSVTWHTRLELFTPPSDAK